jgi:hypothetical protein
MERERERERERGGRDAWGEVEKRERGEREP